LFIRERKHEQEEGQKERERSRLSHPGAPSESYVKELWLIKRMKSCHLQHHTWSQRVFMLSEIRQTEKDRYYIISLICGI